VDIKELNSYAKQLQVNGIESIEGKQAYEQIFAEVYHRTVVTINNYLSMRQLLHLDIDSMISQCLWEGILLSAKTFDETKGDFMNLYLCTVRYRILYILRSELAQKNQPITGSESIEFLMDESSSEDTFFSEEYVTRDKYTTQSDGINELLNRFKAVYGEDRYKVASVVINTEGLPRPLRTKMYKKYLNVPDYTSKDKTRISRVKKQFLDFCKTQDCETILGV